MPICQNCGAELEGKFCTACGAPNPNASAAQTIQPAPMQTPPPVTPPIQQPLPQQPRFNPPPAPIYNNVSVIQQNKVTSTGGWIGWLFLLTLLPLIGHIIMLLCTPDQSAKNFIKAQFVLILIGLLMFLGLLIIAAIGSSM